MQTSEVLLENACNAHRAGCGWIEASRVLCSLIAGNKHIYQGSVVVRYVFRKRASPVWLPSLPPFLFAIVI